MFSDRGNGGAGQGNDYGNNNNSNNAEQTNNFSSGMSQRSNNYNQKRYGQYNSFKGGGGGQRFNNYGGAQQDRFNGNNNQNSNFNNNQQAFSPFKSNNPAYQEISAIQTGNNNNQKEALSHNENQATSNQFYNPFNHSIPSIKQKPPQSHAEYSQQVKKSKIFVPVTLKMVQECGARHDDVCEFDGDVICNIVVLGRLIQKRTEPQRTQFEINDTTSSFRILFYHKSESEQPEMIRKLNAKPLQDYVKIFGQIQVFKDQKAIIGAFIRQVNSSDEITNHFLSVFTSHQIRKNGALKPSDLGIEPAPRVYSQGGQSTAYNSNQVSNDQQMWTNSQNRKESYFEQKCNYQNKGQSPINKQEYQSNRQYSGNNYHSNQNSSNSGGGYNYSQYTKNQQFQQSQNSGTPRTFNNILSNSYNKDTQSNQNRVFNDSYSNNQSTYCSNKNSPHFGPSSGQDIMKPQNHMQPPQFN
eukprot:403356006